jgi:phage baseplate assembly protein W
MLASGNGRPEVCAVNLLQITRGEVPYERIKGLNTALIDRPSEIAAGAVAADAEWVLNTYEPRIQSGGIDIDATLSAVGNFGIGANIVKREEGV